MKSSIRGVALVALVATAAATSAATLNDPSLVLNNIVISGTLNQPTSMAFLATDDILVCEKSTGQVRRILNGAVQGGSVLDLAVANSSEQGLLCIALDPQFASNQSVYLYYTKSSTASDGGTAQDNRVEKFAWNGTSLVFAATVITLPASPGPNHDGGIITFGPPSAPPASQKLFVVIGDLNRNNQLENHAAGAAPDDTGCILRLNADGSTPSGADAGPFFSVPSANASLQRIYAYGVRNCFGMDFDPVTDALWDTENGPTNYDEINRVDPAFNSGWEHVMGPVSRGFFPDPVGAPSPVQFGAIGTYSDPEFSWQNTVAPTAIHFLRGAGLGASYLNDCFAGDNNTGSLYHFEMNPGRTAFALAVPLDDLVADPTDSVSQIVLGTGFGVVTSIRTGPDGNLYVLSLSNAQIYKVSSPTAGFANGGWRLYE